MPINLTKVGEQILSLRKNKQLTQNELGERLNVSFQAVSKWERGETLPDTSILIDLANALETTVDNILNGGDFHVKFKGKMSTKDMREGINCLERVGYLLGKQNIIYRYAIEGISEKMNTDIEPMLNDDFLKECLIAEAIIQNMQLGYYFDMSEVKNNFKHEKWYNTILEYASKHGIK
jgi:transcriptional regulator with XRE-family HTH domain